MAIILQEGKYAARTGLALNKLSRLLDSKEKNAYTIKELTPEHAKEAFNLYQYISTEPGALTDVVRFPDVHHMYHFLASAVKTFGLAHTESGSLMGLATTHPCQLCRSLVPKVCRHSIWVTPELRGIGTGTLLVDVLHSVGTDAGYEGMVGKTGIDNPAGRKVAAKGQGLYKILTGVLPSSSYSQTWGWQDEVIFYTDFHSHQSHKAQKDQASPWPCPPPSPDACVKWLPKINKKVYDLGGLKATISIASNADMEYTHELMYDCATNGDGFAVDEFFSDETFGFKMFKKAAVLVAKEVEDGSRVGVCVIGPSTYYYSALAKVFHCYIVIDPKYRKHGKALGLMSAVEDFAKSQMAWGLLFDPFNVDVPTIKLSRKCGFNVIGSIPKSGFVNNHGLCDSVLMYKPINKWGQ